MKGAHFGTIVGVDCGEGPPVPIPNTEVKLTRAHNTCRVTCREDRSCQHKYSPLAQSVERRTVNPCVVGSSPTGGAIVNTHFRYQLRNVEFKVGIFLYWHKLRIGKFEI